MRRVCLVSGGTGGHLLPAVVLARALREGGHEAMLVTEGRDAEQVLLEGFDCGADAIPVGGGPALPVRMLGAVSRSRRTLRRREVDVVVGTGARTAVPVVLAARSLRLPVALMEQNAVPGRANRMLLPLARRLWLGLPLRGRAPSRALLTGTPVRDDLGTVDRDEARRQLGLGRDGPVILVTGGSQGARALNEKVPAGICALRRPVQVLHLSGPGSDESVRRRYAEGGDHGVVARVRDYAFDMATCYAAADLVICRGGGGTVAELAAAGRGAVIVPYPHHRDRQQLHNGRVLAEAGAAVVLEQGRLQPETLRALLDELLADGRSEDMGERAARLAPRDAIPRILEDLDAVVGLA